MKMPKGLSARQTWRILTAIRKQTAITWPIKTYFKLQPNADLWHTDTQLILSMLTETDAKCRPGSSLHQSLGRANRYTLSGLTAIDLAAACERDGIPVALADVKRLMETRETREAGGRGYDRIVLNALAIHENLKPFVGRRVSPGLIEDLHYRLTAEAGELDLAPLSVRYEVNEDCPYADPDACISILSRLVQNQIDAPSMHVIIGVACIWSLFWDVRPLISCNALVETVIRRIIFERTGYPILSLLPLSNSILGLDRSRTGTERGYESIFEIEARTGVDCTADIEDILSLILKELALLEALVEESIQAEQQLLKKLSAYYKLNLRQTHLLKRLIEAPHQRLSIRSHSKHYGVAYATARSDLLDLVAMGCLKQHKEGRTFYFRSSLQ